MIRATWSYHEHYAEFQKFISAVSEAAVLLLNPLEMLQVPFASLLLVSLCLSLCLSLSHDFDPRTPARRSGTRRSTTCAS